MLKQALFFTLGLCFIYTAWAQEDQHTTCAQNELFNGEMCTCAPGYFASTNNESIARCEDECEEVYYTYFTAGTCIKAGLFNQRPKNNRAFCDSICGVRLRIWTIIGIFLVFAAAICTLIFSIPMCIATCSSCIHSRKASKHSKRIYNESQATPGKDQQLATVSYNPYQYYWPYWQR
ncbi:hypothetical protein M3Y97_01032700 [Aphelenchoides bicaudatus]|nr:hypothetical protein M3Y97_01032700 [Aphelenchoides bicaudatus]